MILQTGGFACGAISTKSFSSRNARSRASRVVKMPNITPSESTTRTVGDLISSLMRTRLLSRLSRGSRKPLPRGEGVFLNQYLKNDKTMHEITPVVTSEGKDTELTRNKKNNYSRFVPRESGSVSLQCIKTLTTDRTICLPSNPS